MQLSKALSRADTAGAQSQKGKILPAATRGSHGGLALPALTARAWCHLLVLPAWGCPVLAAKGEWHQLGVAVPQQTHTVNSSGGWDWGRVQFPPHCLCTGTAAPPSLLLGTALFVSNDHNLSSGQSPCREDCRDVQVGMMNAKPWAPLCRCYNGRVLATTLPDHPSLGDFPFESGQRHGPE